MSRKIVIFGHTTSEDWGFPTPGDMEKYITSGVFDDEDGRYRQTQIRDADIILLSRAGEIYGHFEIEERIAPSQADKDDFPQVKAVYLVRKPGKLYKTRVALKDFDITGIQFGKTITEEQFSQILKLAGDTIP